MFSRSVLGTRVPAGGPRTRLRRVAITSLILTLSVALFVPATALATANNAGGAPASSGLTAPILRVEPVAGEATLSELAWSTQAAAAGYEIQCATDNMFRPNKLVGSAKVDASTSRYRFGGLKQGTTYFYRVRALDGTTNGPFSNTVFFIHGQAHDGANPPVAVAGIGYATWINSPITLDASLSHDPDGTVVKYEWDLDGDGAYDVTTTGPTVTHTPTQPGNRKVHLRVTDNSGLTATDRTFVMVSVDAFPPTAVILGPTEATVGELLFFDGSLSYDDEGAIQSYSWDFTSDGEYEYTSLLPTAQYTFFAPGDWVVRLDVRDSSGNIGAAYQTVRVTQQLEFAPAAPTGLVATDTPDDEGGSITLAWDANTEIDLTGYRVYRATSAEGPFTQVGDAVSASFVDTGLFDGMTYYYQVTAYDAVGLESDPSDTVSASPADNLAPDAPAYVFAEDVAGDETGRVFVSWLQSLALDTAGYIVTATDMLGNVVATADTGAATEHTIDGLTNGITYAFTVQAYDTSGNISEPSDPAYAAPLDDVAPAPPTGLTASPVAAGNAVELAWVGSVSADTAGYLVYRDGAEIADTATATYSDSGLTNGTTYTYTVAAYDAAGNVSDLSEPAVATAADTVAPAAPEGLSATVVPAGNAIDLAWDANSDDAVGYKLYRDGEEIADTGAATTYSDTNLTNGTGYRYTVAAYDAAGNVSHLSAIVHATPADTVAPAVPTGVTAADRSADEGGAIVVSWDANTDDTTGYLVHVSDAVAGTTTTYDAGNATTYTLAGLTDGREYEVAVSAYDAAGNDSALSVPAYATPADNLPPAAPTNLTATPVPAGSAIKLTWTPGTSPDTAGYRIKRDGVQIADVGAATTTYTDTNLTNGTAYTYTMVSYDAAGNLSSAAHGAAGTAGPVMATAADTVAPKTPAGLSATPLAQGGAVDLFWTANTDDAIGYLLYRDGVQIADIADPAETTYADANLANGTTYAYTLAAYDAAGNVSAPCAAVSATPQDTVAPATPTGLTAADRADDEGGAIVVSWTPNDDDTFYYMVRLYLDGTPVTELLTQATQVEFTGLTNGTTYEVTVAARDEAGNESPASAPASATPADNLPPAAPTGLTASPVPAYGRVELAWTASISADTAGHKVYRDGIEIADITGSAWTDEDATINAQHTYTVTAYDAAGNESAPSNPAVCTLLPPLPTPTGVSAADPRNHGGQLWIAWDESVDERVVAYNVYRTQTSGSGYAFAGTTNEWTFLDTGLTNGETYYYVVRAIDAEGIESADSAEVSAVPKDNSGIVQGRFENTHPEIYYTAGWRLYDSGVYEDEASDGSVHLASSTASGAKAYETYAEFTFEGTQVTWIGVRGFNRGIAAVYLNGIFVGNVDCYKPGSTITDFEWQAPVYTSPEMPYGEHTIKVVYTGTRNPAATHLHIDIDAFDVVYVPDVDPPSVPANISAALQPTPEGRALNVSWSASPEADLAGYKLYRATDIDGPYRLIATLGKVMSHQDTGLENGMTYYYKVVAFDTSDNLSARSDAAWCAPFAAPTGATVTDHPNDEGTALDIRWNARPESSVTGYRVYRSSTAGGSYSLVATLGEVTEWTDFAVTKNSTRYYKVAAYDAAGNVSAQSAYGYGTAIDNLPPATPSIASATAIQRAAGGRIEVRWSANSESDLAGYKLYRATELDGEYQLVATLGKVTSYLDTGLTNAVTYYYKLAAFDTSNNLSGTAAAVWATPESMPASKLSARNTPHSLGSVGLVWEKSTATDLAGYTVYRSDAVDGVYAVLATIGNVTTYTDSGRTEGVTYFYKVAARGSAGDVSSPTEAASVTISPEPFSDARYENTHSAIYFTAGWDEYDFGVYEDEASDGSVHLSGTNTSAVAYQTYAEFTFEGSYVTWIGVRAFNRGIAAVYINGELMKYVDCYKPGSTIDDFEWQAPLYTSPTLPYGTHTIRVAYTGTKNPSAGGRNTIDIDAFDVRQ